MLRTDGEIPLLFIYKHIKSYNGVVVSENTFKSFGSRKQDNFNFILFYIGFS